MAKVAIFGATSAIAAAAARAFVARGDDLALIGRDAQKLAAVALDLKVRGRAEQTIATFQADLDARERHAEWLAAAQAALGGIDIVLIAQGTLPDQKACEADLDLMRAAFETNALSVISLAALSANLFERERRGAIVVIGSVAGDRGRQSNYVYGSAKGMVAIFCQGLRNRLAPAGVSVTLVKPGLVDTPMTAGFEKKGLLWADAATVGRIVARAAARGADVVYAPGFWFFIMAVIKAIPERVFKRLKL